VRLRGNDTAIIVHLRAAQHALELHPSLRLDLQFLHKRPNRILRSNDPCHASDSGAWRCPHILARSRTINKAEQLACVADDNVESLRDRYVLLCARLLRATHPPTKCLGELILPPDDGKPERDLAPTAVCLPSELFRCLVQYIAQARSLALLSGERGLRRGELRMQRRCRCCVARGEGLKRSL
jgi:hypothetical protein